MMTQGTADKSESSRRGGVLRQAACRVSQREATERCFSQHKANDVRGPAAVSPDGCRLESEGEKRNLTLLYFFLLFQCFNFNDLVVIHYGTYCSFPLNLVRLLFTLGVPRFLLNNLSSDCTIYFIIVEPYHLYALELKI